MGLDPMKWGEHPAWFQTTWWKWIRKTGKPVADSAEPGLHVPVFLAPKGIDDLIAGQKALVEAQTKLAAAVEEIARRPGGESFEQSGTGRGPPPAG